MYVKFTPQGLRSKLPYPHRDTFPTFRRIYDAYGPERLMWGTDFPHVLKTPGYSPALELFRTHMDFLIRGRQGVAVLQDRPHCVEVR